MGDLECSRERRGWTVLGVLALFIRSLNGKDVGASFLKPGSGWKRYLWGSWVAGAGGEKVVGQQSRCESRS